MARRQSSAQEGRPSLLSAEWFVGIDWSPEVHEICIVDREGRVVRGDWRVPHTVAGLESLVDALMGQANGDPTRVVIAIETPRVAIVDLLVERGFAVYALNPKQLDRFRDRFTTAGAKDDQLDARVLGDSLRTDSHAFRRVRLDDPLVIQLREWSRLDDELASEVHRVSNQVRDLVYRSAPHLLTLCPAADEPWFWMLLAAAPTPAEQRRLTERRIARLLREHRIRRVASTEVWAVVQQPAVYTAPGVVDAVAAHLQVLLPRLTLVARQRGDAERTLKRLLDAIDAEQAGDQREHSDVAIIRSMPGIGTRIAARMLAEGASALVDRAYHALRGTMGVAPVTRKSGRTRTVSMRYACNHRLRQAAFLWAFSSLSDPRSREYYDRLRARGHSHARALRSVADRLLRVLCKLLERGQRFNPSYGVAVAPQGA
jgi:transposase